MKTNSIFVSLFRVTQNSTLACNQDIKNKICLATLNSWAFFCYRPKHNQYSLIGGCLRGFRPLSNKTLKLALLNSKLDATLSVRSQTHYTTHLGNKAGICSLSGGRGQTPNLTKSISNLFKK